MNNQQINKKGMKFYEMGIDDRILEGLARLKWTTPTRVQEKAIPFVLEGKTVVAEARTGSGKTGAFLIPCLHRILAEKTIASKQCVRLLILAPTKELCRQITTMASQLTAVCSREVKILDLSPHLPLEDQRSMLKDLPDVIVGPPRRVLAHIKDGNLSLSEVLSVVVDEADLMLAFHHNDDIVELWKYLPSHYQSFITSATLGKDMKYIKNFLSVGSENIKELTKNIIILRLKEPPLPTTSQLNHYVIKLEDFEKAVLLLHIFKNKLLSGKTIIFVNNIAKAYKLRMFLGQFAISTCILNCELPANCRCDIIEQFNSGSYETIIAVDNNMDKKDKLKGISIDIESGTSRGLDFQFVSNIINFDFPSSTVGYIHRVGRTARVNNQGTALNMVSMDQQQSYTSVLTELSELMEVTETNKKNCEGIFKKFTFNIDDYDTIRYRASDPWRACTNKMVLSARKREIGQQLLNSKKLDAYFRANPRDKALLRHDKSVHGVKAQNHLKKLPSYNMSDKTDIKDLKQSTNKKYLKRLQGKNKNALQGKNKNTEKEVKMFNRNIVPSKNQKKKMSYMNNPLKKLEFSGFSK